MSAVGVQLNSAGQFFEEQMETATAAFIQVGARLPLTAPSQQQRLLGSLPNVIVTLRFSPLNILSPARRAGVLIFENLIPLPKQSDAL